MTTYFISDGTHVKIGKSLNPDARLTQLQTSHHAKLELLFVLYGDYESCLHQHFADCRVNGEWFYKDGLNAFLSLSHDQRLAFVTRLTRPLELISNDRLRIVDNIMGLEHLLICPYCNDGANIYQHIGAPQQDADETNTYVHIPVSGECGHDWSIVFSSHAGHTCVFVGGALGDRQ